MVIKEMKQPGGPVKTFLADLLTVRVYASQADLAADAAREVNGYLQRRIAENGSAAAILATGNSQIDFLSKLVALKGVDWSRVTLFHMDEYLGIPGDHKASFQRYMRERVESLIRPKIFHYLQGDTLLPLDECERYAALLKAQPIDLCCLGIGENGHLAFNDPPVARFDDPHWVKLVKLDDACKMQQVKQGHFPSMEAMPPYAFTVTVPALCSAAKLVCLSPEIRKAEIVRRVLQGAISTECPASILRKQAHAALLLDTESASRL